MIKMIYFILYLSADFPLRSVVYYFLQWRAKGNKSSQDATPKAEHERGHDILYCVEPAHPKLWGGTMVWTCYNWKSL